MFSCQKLWILSVLSVLLLGNHQSWANPLAKAADEPSKEGNVEEVTKLLLITDDVIHDEIEKDIKKVIRLNNPLNLPPLKPNQQNSRQAPNNSKRNYINILRPPMLNGQQSKSPLSDTSVNRAVSLLATATDKILKAKHQPKKKNLHFLYNQKDSAGNLLSKSLPVHVAPGAYPVYYVVAKANGRFGKYPLKSFGSPRTFAKYLQKTKLEKLPTLEPLDEGVRV